mmetsp:Transcript_16938/g.64194  ORF Transcript_16938/g.64194 Transcript_16938/m.64194 type:complete len:286 (+) Transcript_16938:1604-2461(+)
MVSDFPLDPPAASCSTQPGTALRWRPDAAALPARPACRTSPPQQPTPACRASASTQTPRPTRKTTSTPSCRAVSRRPWSPRARQCPAPTQPTTQTQALARRLKQVPLRQSHRQSHQRTRQHHRCAQHRPAHRCWLRSGRGRPASQATTLRQLLPSPPQPTEELPTGPAEPPHRQGATSARRGPWEPHQGRAGLCRTGWRSHLPAERCGQLIAWFLQAELPKDCGWPSASGRHRRRCCGEQSRRRNRRSRPLAPPSPPLLRPIPTAFPGRAESGDPAAVRDAWWLR